MSKSYNEKSDPAPVYKYKDINFDNIKNLQNPILVQGPKIKSHGIPPLNKEFCTSDNKREFIKIPLDPGQPACDDLRKYLEAADAWAGASAMREMLSRRRPQ